MPRHGRAAPGEPFPGRRRRRFSRLTSSSTGDRSPRSPEATRTPSGQKPGGVLFPAFAKETCKPDRRCLFDPEAPGCDSEAGESVHAAQQRCAWVLRHGRRTDGHRKHGPCARKDCRFARGGNAQRQRVVQSGTGLFPVRFARLCRGACPCPPPRAGGGR